MAVPLIVTRLTESGNCVAMMATLKSGERKLIGLDRVLDSLSSSTTLETLQRSAKIVGRKLRVELV